MNGKKAADSFSKQAAKASWIIPLLALGMMAVGNSVMKTSSSTVGPLILGGFVILFFLAGIILGIISLFGIKVYGKKGILTPAIIGILLNVSFLSLLLMIAISAFKKASTGS